MPIYDPDGKEWPKERQIRWLIAQGWEESEARMRYAIEHGETEGDERPVDEPERKPPAEPRL